jgi:dihydrofolate reductase
MDRTDRIYLTRIHLTVDGDTFLPELPENEWQEVERREFEKGERDDAAFTLVVLDRVKHG